MALPFAGHWLEAVIGAERDPNVIAAKIAQSPEFIAIINDAIQFAQKESMSGGNQARIIAEHIAHLLHQSFGGFATMH